MLSFVCIAFVFLGVVSSTVPDSEREALVSFYQSTKGANWTKNHGWLTGDPCTNDWFGVFCERSGDHIHQLTQTNQSLDGTIPFALNNLTYLKAINIEDNPSLVGTIPSFFYGMEKLEAIFISSNGVVGSIPKGLGKLEVLKDLYLDSNQLSGTIPDDFIGGAPYAQISLTDNQLDGTIPETFCKLMTPDKLEELYLGQNSFTGSIPPCLGSNFKNLNTIEMDGNSFEGNVPFTISELPKLKEIVLDGNQLSGNLPDSLVTHSLRTFSVSDNAFQGTIPDYSLNFNIPGEETRVFFASNNQLSGILPDWLCGDSVTKFDVEGNFFDCPLPSCCNQTNEVCGVCQE